MKRDLAASILRSHFTSWHGRLVLTGSEFVPSPCIGVCVLDANFGQWCIGCHRHLVEITDWSSYTKDQQLQIIERIETLRAEDPNDYPDYK
jgi:predicted Fe-S protein YdhL (DUF1289 family)